MICEQYPPKAWINVYTDGSATNAIQDSGAGIAINFPSISTEAASAATQKTLQQLQSRVRGIAYRHLFCYGITTEEHHGCISQ